jgi:hypothetical protein
MVACALALSFGLVGCGSAGGSAGSPGASSATAADDPFAQPIESETDALNRIHDSLMRAGKELPPKLECGLKDDDGRYLVRGYEVVDDGGGYSHEATWFIYAVDEDGSIWDAVLLVDIDPETMEPMAG